MPDAPLASSPPAPLPVWARVGIAAVVLLPAVQLLEPAYGARDPLQMAWFRWEQVLLSPQWAMVCALMGLGIAALVVAVVTEARAIPRRVWPGLLAVVGLAFVLRWMAPDAPHDINDRSIGAFHTPLLRADYGWGLPSFMATMLWLVPGVPQVQWTLYHFGPFLSALTAGMLVPLARALGGSWRVGLAAAGLFAVATPAVRFGHTDTHAIPESLFFVAAVLAVLRFAAAPRWAPALAAGLWASLALSMRPEGPLLALFLLGVASAVLSRGAWRHPALWAGLVAGGPATLAHVDAALHKLAVSESDRRTMSLFTEQGQINHALFHEGPRHLLSFDPTYTHPWISVLLLIGVLLGPVPRRTRLVLGALAIGLALIVPGVHWTAAGGQPLVLARHQLRAVPFVALGVAFGLAWLFARLTNPVPRAAVTLATVAAALAPLPLNYVPRTYAEEHRWAREALTQVPDGCVLLFRVPPGDWSLNLQYGISSQIGRDHTWVAVNDGLPEPAECEFWYRSANCSVVGDYDGRGVYAGLPRPGLDHCRDDEAALILEPVREGLLPAAPYAYDDFAEEPVRVGVYRVLGRRPQPSVRPAP